MARFDEFKEANERYAAFFDKGDLPMTLARQVAVVTCIHLSIADVFRVLFLTVEMRQARL